MNVSAKTLDYNQNSSCIDTEACETDTTMLSASQESGLVQPKGNGENSGRIKIESNWGGHRPGAGRPRKVPSTARVIQYKTGPRWYVIRTGFKAEQRVVTDLAVGETRRGYIPRPSYETYLPLVRVKRTIRGERCSVTAPMVLGYVFVRFDHQHDQWKPIVSCDGVLELFSTRGGLPIPITDAELDGLRQQSESNLGLDPLKAPIMPPRQPGEQLRVTRGAFAGHTASCLACDGVTTQAELNLFGRTIPVEMAWTDFEAA